MQIQFKPFMTRLGELMLYINGSNGCSVPLTQKDGWQSTKSTAGQKKAVNAAMRAVKHFGRDFTGSVEAHAEGKYTFGHYTLLVTDVAEIGGQKVGSDGSYIVREGKYVPCGAWIDEDGGVEEWEEE